MSGQIGDCDGAVGPGAIAVDEGRVSGHTMGIGAVAIVREFVAKGHNLGKLGGPAWQDLTRRV